VIKPDELSGAARESYDMWRRIGLFEQAALDSVIEDGLVPLSDHDQLARTFRQLGLSQQAAESAADGRDGPSGRPVSEASRPGPQPGDNQRLIALVEQWASDLRFNNKVSMILGGESLERASIREAYLKVKGAAQNDVQLLWICAVVESRWPGLMDPLLPKDGGKGSSGSKSTQTRSVGETTRQPGRRTVSE
jgi:hypothetical protein